MNDSTNLQKTGRIYKADYRKSFVVIPNSTIQDENLSFRARGVLSYILSLPDTWQVYKSEIVNHAPEGKHAITTAFNELMQERYVFMRENRDQGKFAGYSYYVFATPQTDFPFTVESEKRPSGQLEQGNTTSPQTDFPKSEKPKSEKPKSDNQTLQKKHYTKDTYNKKYSLLYEKICQFFPEKLLPDDKGKNAWVNDLRLLIEKDELTEDEIINIVKWARNDPFWQSNFLSLLKLRKKNKEGIPYYLVFKEKMRRTSKDKKFVDDVNDLSKWN